MRPSDAKIALRVTVLRAARR